jgi:hypothetical protein
MIEIKRSGNKLTVKITPSNIENRLNNCRVLDREKGTRNPPHAHVKVPPSWAKK